MFRRGFFFRAIGFILVAGLLFAAGSALYRAGYSQGITAGAAMASAESGLNAPWPGGLANPYFYPYGYGFGRGPSFGIFFLGGLALLFLAGFFFRPRRMWHAAGKHGHPHGWNWDQYPEGTPPWGRFRQDSSDKEQAGADAATTEGDDG